MTTNTETMVNLVDTPIDSTPSETSTVEENRTLRHVIAQFLQAWANGQEPPKSIPKYGPFYNSAIVPSTTGPQGMPFRNNLNVTPSAPIYTLQQPIVVQRAAQEGHFTTHPEKYHTPGIEFGGPNYVKFGTPIDVERPTQSSEQEEILKKMKRIEQHMKTVKRLRGHKSITFKDLCMLPNVHMPPGFKTPRFDKFDRHGDPIAHLKRYYNQLRGVGGKEELLMDYFGEIRYCL
ncbi:uncharacterized protein LOC114076889 [Solanum pennellii]|uniref:Uncharacterized protein LOC114076889 n=1 Tax=Solanum pennellii TaxID=28526 RepID=A0ABM1V9H0_SOLPN|nr:uncharacterized protein LOC114076889 [Solanum pennellii]